jgi:hypothetical protein
MRRKSSTSGLPSSSSTSVAAPSSNDQVTPPEPAIQPIPNTDPRRATTPLRNLKRNKRNGPPGPWSRGKVIFTVKVNLVTCLVAQSPDWWLFRTPASDFEGEREQLLVIGQSRIVSGWKPNSTLHHVGKPFASC